MKVEEDTVFPVYIYDKVLSEIKKLCKGSKLEIFGYLVGEIFIWKDTPYIIIENYLFIKGAVHSHQFSTAQIEGTAGKYDDEFQKLKKKKKSDTLRIVGWWHSHPGFTCFLSAVDIATQEFFFPEKYQTALVVDPVNKDLRFFTLDNGEKRGYREIGYAVLKS